MKIKAAMMKHFGRFSEKTVEFGDGLNLIEGDNESGKSTLHAFIRGMLFGIEKTRGRSGKNELYEHFLPWDTPGAYQGSLDIEHNGRNFRISRVFLQNAKSCVVTDLDTGEVCDWQDSGITALIGELTPGAFDNTVSCAQQQLKSRADFGSYIRTYIANMADSRDSRVDVASALEKLDDRAKAITREIRSTDEDGAREELNSLLEDEKDEGCIIADRDEAVKQLETLEAELSSLEAPEGTASGRASLQERYERLQSLILRIKDIKKTETDIGDTEAKAEETGARLRICEEKLAERKASCAAAAGEFERFGKELEEASSAENDPKMIAKEADEAAQTAQESHDRADSLKEKISAGRAKVGKILLSGGIMTAVGLIAAFLSSDRLKPGIIAGILITLVGLVLLLIGCVESKTVKKEEKEVTTAEERYREDAEKAEELQKRLRTQTELLTGIKLRLQAAQLKLKDEEAAYRETEVERNMTSERLNELREELERKSSGFEPEKESICREARELLYGTSGLISGISDTAGLLEATESASAECSREIADYDTGRRRLEQAISEKNKELAHIEGTLIRYGDIGERIDEATKKLEEIRAGKEKLQLELDAVKQAAATIREISDELKGGFDRRINELLSRNCAEVTAGKYTQARITQDCEPEVFGDTGYIQVKDLSVGTGEQIFLAFRLAMSEFLFGNTEIPMIFDEIFAYYDDERLRAALKAVGNIANRQILLFTCSHRERSVLDEMGIGYKRITL